MTNTADVSGAGTRSGTPVEDSDTETIELLVVAGEQLEAVAFDGRPSAQCEGDVPWFSYDLAVSSAFDGRDAFLHWVRLDRDGDVVRGPATGSSDGDPVRFADGTAVRGTIEHVDDLGDDREGRVLWPGVAVDHDPSTRDVDEERFRWSRDSQNLALFVTVNPTSAAITGIAYPEAFEDCGIPPTVEGPRVLGTVLELARAGFTGSGLLGLALGLLVLGGVLLRGRPEDRWPTGS